MNHETLNRKPARNQQTQNPNLSGQKGEVWGGEKGWEGRIGWRGLPPLRSCEEAPSMNSGSLHTARSRTSGLRPAYTRDDGRSSFLASDQRAVAYLFL